MNVFKLYKVLSIFKNLKKFHDTYIRDKGVLGSQIRGPRQMLLRKSFK